MKLSALLLLLLCFVANVLSHDSHYHKDALVKIQVDNLSSATLTPQEIDFMDRVWKDAFLTVNQNDDISFDSVTLDSQDNAGGRKLWWRFSYSAMYGFRFNYWCDLCWDDPCYWGYRRGRQLRKHKSRKSPKGAKKSDKSPKAAKKNAKDKKPVPIMDIDRFEQVFCNMLSEGPFEVFQGISQCKVVLDF